VVGFDTATDDTVVAACDGSGIAFELTAGPGEDGRPTHSAALLDGLSRAADALGGWTEVDRLAVGIGPGTFTGLRIGLATATGLALSTGVELAGVPTLAALARSLAGGGEAGARRVPMLDAKRGEVFAAVYDDSGEKVRPEVAAAPGAAIEMILELGLPVTVGGPGAVRFADLFGRAGIAVVDPASRRGRLAGEAICRIGAAVAPAGPDNPLKPIYIRAPDAQLWLERDRSKPPG
jgi:tRNA threonylcarbamoyladenosine biosynthesis protein TsaB